MLTKHFVKQDLPGGELEDEKTDKSARKERRGGTAGPGFDTRTVTERLKCQIRFLSRGSDGARGSAPESRFDTQSLEAI